MIRELHAGLGKVRLGLAHIRASLGRPFKAVYLRPIIFTTNAERVHHSPYHWGLVERAGVVHRQKGLKYAPRSWRRRARIGRFLAPKLGLEATKFKWRESKTFDRNKWGLSLKAIVYSWVHPRPKPESMYKPRALRQADGPALTPFFGDGPKFPHRENSLREKLAQVPDAVEIAWSELTPAEKRAASRKAGKTDQIAI